jgi:hypothetical protein
MRNLQGKAIPNTLATVAPVSINTVSKSLEIIGSKRGYGILICGRDETRPSSATSIQARQASKRDEHYGAQPV